MRTFVLVTSLASALIACTPPTSAPPPNRPSPSATARAAPIPPTAQAPNAPPPAGAPIERLASWIAAGPPAPGARYGLATQDDGTITTLDAGDVAFTTPSKKITCTTQESQLPALQCLVGLLRPPPRPDGVPGEWIGTWVDFDGAGVTVGSIHGDPGPFMRGRGGVLPYGQTLSFSTFRCRADPVGLFCLDGAHHTGVRYSDAGVEPFGCLHAVEPTRWPDGNPVGLKFGC